MSKVINWTQYFMGVAKLSAYRSKDPNTQVGACIVNNDNKIAEVKGKVKELCAAYPLYKGRLY